MNRLPSLLRSTPPSPRTPSVTRIPLHAGRPDHAGRMELHELHIEQRRARVIRERMAVAGVFPTVAGDLKRAADSAGRQHHRLGVKQLEASALAIVSERAHAAVAILQQREDGGLHVEVDALMDAVILQACGSFRDRCDRRRAPAADSDGRRNCAAECGRPWCDRTSRPRLPVPAREPALPWRAAPPCASCSDTARRASCRRNGRASCRDRRRCPSPPPCRLRPSRCALCRAAISRPRRP